MGQAHGFVGRSLAQPEDEEILVHPAEHVSIQQVTDAAEHLLGIGVLPA